MLKIISKTGALKAFYFLISLDGTSDFVLNRFQEIGLEMFPDEFESIKESIISECTQQIASASDDDELYDVIQEGIDAALSDTVSDIQLSVVPRLLIWDMLSLAHSDDNYSENENRLLSHVARILKIDKSVFAEMKQLISTAASVQKELDQFGASNKPYAEIKPLVDECEKRRLTIIEAAKALIEDDILLEPLEDNNTPSENSILNMGKKLGESILSESKKLEEKVSPTAKDLGAKTMKGILETSAFLGSKVEKGSSDLKVGADKLFSRMKNSIKNDNIVLPSNYKKIKKKLPADLGIPKDAAAYNMANANTSAIVVCFPVSAESSMKFDDPVGLIDELHNNMDDMAGIIEVQAGSTTNGNRYIYHIMKHSNISEDGIRLGNTYTINFNIEFGDTIQFLNASFDEIGTTGIRDTTILAFLQNSGDIDINSSDWICDPYNPEFNKGFLMNKSEQRQFDKMFPEHPLSVARTLIEFIISNH